MNYLVQSNACEAGKEWFIKNLQEFILKYNAFCKEFLSSDKKLGNYNSSDIYWITVLRPRADSEYSLSLKQIKTLMDIYKRRVKN